jgi:hypothetical protein
VPEGGHRPVTLAFCTEKSVESIREAFFARRTVAWFNNTLIGREAELIPLINACLQVERAAYIGTSQVAEVEIFNDSDVEYILLNQSPFTLHANADVIILHPNTTTIQVKTVEEVESFSLEFTVLNAVTAPKTHPRIRLEVEMN